MKRELGAEPAGRAGSPSDVLGEREAAERILRGRYGPGDRFVEDDAETVARAYLELVENRGGGTQSNSVREALEKIAKQELSADMTVDQQLDGDFEGAYNHMIEIAREARSEGKISK